MPYVSDVPRLQLLVILPSNVPNFWCRTKNHICKFIFWMKGIFSWRSQAPIAKNRNKWTLSTRSWVVCDIIANQFYNYANEPTVCKLTPSVNKFLHWLLFKTDFWFTSFYIQWIISIAHHLYFTPVFIPTINWSWQLNEQDCEQSTPHNCYTKNVQVTNKNRLLITLYY